jgi:hypothetical protein
MIGAALLLQVLWLFAAGCSKNPSPPAPLSVEQLPAALEKAFTKAKPEAKDLANQIVTFLQAQDYSKAYTGLQNLLGKPGLTKEQMSVATRGSLTLTTLLQSAQASGDAKAAETLKAYRINK